MLNYIQRLGFAVAATVALSLVATADTEAGALHGRGFYRSHPGGAGSFRGWRPGRASGHAHGHRHSHRYQHSHRYPHSYSFPAYGNYDYPPAYGDDGYPSYGDNDY